MLEIDGVGVREIRAAVGVVLWVEDARGEKGMRRVSLKVSSPRAGLPYQCPSPLCCLEVLAFLRGVAKRGNVQTVVLQGGGGSC